MSDADRNRNRTPGEDIGSSNVARNPADPADTNYDHPGAAGSRKSAPGAGIVSAEADAGPSLGDRSIAARTTPANPTAPPR